jgi:flagellar biosynthesis anti-sigma factor FlgM
MRIHDAHPTPVDLGVKPFTGKSASASGAASSASVDGKLTVSDKARELAAAASQNESRVEELRQSIRDGTFKIDSRAVASKMLDEGDAVVGGSP